LPSVTSFRQPLASRMYFSARTEGRISYGHLGRTDSCFRHNSFIMNVEFFAADSYVNLHYLCHINNLYSPKYMVDNNN